MSVAGATNERASSWLVSVRGNVARALATLVRAPSAVTRPRWRSYGTVAAAAIATAIVLAVMMAFIDAPAHAATRNVPTWVFNVFEKLTTFGQSSWFLIPIAIVLAAIAIRAPALPRWSQPVLASVAVRFGFVFVAIAAPSLFATVIKRLIARARPYIGDPFDPFLFRPGVWRSEYASLPSGHATVAFAALVAIGALWPRLRPVLWVYAVLIAVSRVVVHAHHPSDVVAGAVVGAVGALLVRDWFAARRLGFTITADGRVRELPGPTFARIKRVAGRVLAP
jgi:undecaprenyl-diphosphatase